MANKVKESQFAASEPASGVGTPPANGKENPAESKPNAAGATAAYRIPPEECRECLTAMTHRLVQPLTALRGGLELGLLGKPTEADYRALLQQSMQLADTMAQMIISLRDIGESGVSAGPYQSIRLESAVQDALAEAETWAQSRDLALQLQNTSDVNVRANPQRLREALQSLFAWVIQNSAGGGVMVVELSGEEGEASVFLSPPKLDWQYLQVKMLEDITTPGVLFSRAARIGTLGWAINQRLVNGIGGKIEILPVDGSAGRIRLRLPLTPPG